MSVTLDVSYHYEQFLRECIDEKWIAFQLTDHTVTGWGYRYDLRTRINRWCMNNFGMPYGIYSPRTYLLNKVWFYAFAKISGDEDYIFFKNEMDASFFALTFANDIVR